MSTGKTWTLKLSKDDETTPGPAYQTQYLHSMAKKGDDTAELKNGSFGAFRDRQRTIPNKGFEKAFLGVTTPGPNLYSGSQTTHLKASLSVARNSQKYSVPKVRKALYDNFMIYNNLFLYF